MIEPTTPIPDDFLPVQAVSVVYVVLTLGVTITAVRMGLPLEMSVPVFLGVALLLLIPFVPLFRRFHPEH